MRDVIALVGRGIHALDAYFLVRQRSAHVAHQSSPVEGLDCDIHGEFSGARLAPGYAKDSCGRLDAETREVCAGLGMDADAASHRDVADDGLGWYRLATASVGREEIADALHLDLRLPFYRGPRTDRLDARFTSVHQPLHGTRHLAAAYLAETQCLMQGFRARQFEFAQQFRHRRTVHTQTLHLALEHRPAFAVVLRRVLLAEPRTNFVAVPGAREKAGLRREPVARRLRRLGGDDFHRIAVLESIIERHHAAVDLGAAGAVAEIRMHLIGEIQGCAAHRDIDDFALRRHHVDSVLK